MGMLNSLFCFMNVLCSSLQNRWLTLFMIGTFLHFLCLYQIILKVIHKIGMVNYLETNEDNPMQARWNIAIMHVQIYFVVLMGLLFGMNRFPNKIDLLSIPIFFLIQVFYIGFKNNRLFPSIQIHYSLALSKIVFCIYSRCSFFKKFGE